jgi:hypothetical protein
MRKEKEKKSTLEYLQDERDANGPDAQKRIDNYFFANPSKQGKKKQRKKKRVSNSDDLWW